MLFRSAFRHPSPACGRGAGGEGWANADIWRLQQAQKNARGMRTGRYVFQPSGHHISTYNSTILTTRIAKAVGTWALMTAYLSFSSSKAAGTMLKFAAMGVISVPQ